MSRAISPLAEAQREDREEAEGTEGGQGKGDRHRHRVVFINCAKMKNAFFMRFSVFAAYSNTFQSTSNKSKGMPIVGRPGRRPIGSELNFSELLQNLPTRALNMDSMTKKKSLSDVIADRYILVHSREFLKS
jgi:hypothetical protein